MSSYFPMTGFKTKVCASTGDNRHNCAPTRWGNLKYYYDSNRRVVLTGVSSNTNMIVDRSVVLTGVSSNTSMILIGVLY